MMSSTKIELKVKEIHEKAVKEGKEQYTDPDTGYLVFTDLFHKRRGKCCGNVCRHCPFNYENVKAGNKTKVKSGNAKLVVESD